MRIRIMLFTLCTLVIAACDDATSAKPLDNEAGADTTTPDEDTLTPGCGNGVVEVEEEEVCEKGQQTDCTTITSGYTGTAVCRDDCSGWDATTCTDMDECAEDPTICGDPAYASCKNTDGAFECTCTNGYLPTSDKRLCVPRYDFEGPEYVGDLLLVVNDVPDGNYQAYIGTLPKDLLMAPPSEEPAEVRAATTPFPTFGRIAPLPPHITREDYARRIYRAIEPVPDPDCPVDEGVALQIHDRHGVLIGEARAG